jgi:hypothetical protein
MFPLADEQPIGELIEHVQVPRYCTAGNVRKSDLSGRVTGYIVSPKAYY